MVLPLQIAVDWAKLPDVCWDKLLDLLTQRDIRNVRATCKAWRGDTERCLHRLHLRDPTPDCLRLVGHTFACVSRLKLTATASPTPPLSPAPSFTLSTLSTSTSASASTTEPPSPVPSAPGTPTADTSTSGARPLDLDLSQPHAGQLLCGSLSRVGHLGLRSKRPGGCVLCVGHLQVLQPTASALRSLCLRSCAVESWAGLEACSQLSELRLLGCRLGAPAAQGLVRCLAALPRLASLELGCTAAPGRGPTAAAHAGQQQGQGQEQVQGQVQQGQEQMQQGQGEQGQPGQHGQGQEEQGPAQGEQGQQEQMEQRQQGPAWRHPYTHARLEGLGAAAPRLAVLRLAAALGEVGLRQLLRVELPGIHNLQELSLELLPVHGSGLQLMPPPANAGPLAAHPAAPLPPANAPAPPQQQHHNHRYELASILPAVCVAAPRLTSLTVMGHTAVSDRDLQLLCPLRQLRHVSLDTRATCPGEVPPDAAAPHLQQPDHAPQQQAHHHHQQHQHQPSTHRASGPLGSAGVSSLLLCAPSLQSLSLAHSTWDREGLRALIGATGLRRLSLAGVELPQGVTLCSFLPCMRSLPHLVALDLSRCAALSDWGLAQLARAAPCLAELRLSGCDGTGAGAGAARGEELGVAGGMGAGAGAGAGAGEARAGGGGGGRGGAWGLGVSDVGVRALAPLMRRMQRLDLSFLDSLSDGGLEGLLRHGAPDLTHLNLAFCTRITNAGLAAISGSCPSLRDLDLDHCTGLGPAGVRRLAALRELRHVSMDGCGAAAVSELQRLPGPPRPRSSRAAGMWWMA